MSIPQPAPQQPYPGSAPVARTNTMAILALVLSFIMPIAGIVLGVLAKKEIERTGEEGRGLATAGLVIGIVYCALIALFVILWFAIMIFTFSVIPWSLTVPN